MTEKKSEPRSIEVEMEINAPVAIGVVVPFHAAVGKPHYGLWRRGKHHRPAAGTPDQGEQQRDRQCGSMSDDVMQDEIHTGPFALSTAERRLRILFPKSPPPESVPSDRP